jgi:hypothetical protein
MRGAGNLAAEWDASSPLGWIWNTQRQPENAMQKVKIRRIRLDWRSSFRDKRIRTRRMDRLGSRNGHLREGQSNLPGDAQTTLQLPGGSEVRPASGHGLPEG